MCDTREPRSTRSPSADEFEPDETSAGDPRDERRSRRSFRRRHGRKERILHTRVSDELSDDIRQLANDLRVPVSNLVRNVLEEVFSVVERVSGDVGEVLGDVLEEAEEARERMAQRAAARRQRSQRSEQARPEPSAFDDVLGWQPLVTNRPVACAGCRCPLERGQSAFVGLTEQGPSGAILCEACVAKL